MFREELEDLKNEHLRRLCIINVLKDESQDIALFSGRVDAKKCSESFEHWIDLKSVDTAYICGPEPLMLTIAAALKEHGLDEQQIRFELFASGQPGRARKRAVTSDDSIADVVARTTLDGESVLSLWRRIPACLKRHWPISWMPHILARLVFALPARQSSGKVRLR